ncbi:MAG: metallophosphoesterase [Bacteroidales bacterium]|nr:metallophosphoesterase [Bacteroidales bacterium]
MRKNLLTIGLILLVCLCYSQSYKFAVICDTRSDGDHNGEAGVNVSAVKAVCNHLKKSGAEFVIAPGDFICGNVKWYNSSESPPSNHTQYQTFLNAAQSEGVVLPGKKGDITIYPVRGNHECYQQILTEDCIELAWTANIGYALPENGPDNEIGFTYSFLYKGSLFVGLDQYMHASADKKSGIGLDQNWLNEEIQKNPKAEHIFAFGHTPAFAAQHQDCLGEDSIARNTFLQSINGRTGVYFCGHDHFYARAKIPVYNQTGRVDNYLQQVITPSGAPFLGGFSPKWDGKYKNQNTETQSYMDNVLGYQLVTVDGDKVTVEFIATNDACTFCKDPEGKYHYLYNENWQTWSFETMDKFSYKLNANSK